MSRILASLEENAIERGGGAHPVGWTDVQSFARPAKDEDAVVDEVARDFGEAELVRDYGKERLEALFDDLYDVGQDELNRRFNSRPPYLMEGAQGRSEETASTYKSARRLFRVALGCLELLGRPAGDLRYGDARGLGVMPTICTDGRSATIELEFTGYVEGSNYLQHLANSCRDSPGWLKCRTEGVSSTSTPDGYWGWTTMKAGFLRMACGEHQVECSECPDRPEDALSDAQVRESLTSLLNGLITVHIQDARPYSAGREGLKLSGGCLLSGLWLALLEGMKEGELSFCPACGKPFLIKGYQGSKRVWCEMNSTCSKRGQRARRFGRLCKLGHPPEVAGREAGMKPAAARRILERLGELDEGVDYGI